MGFGDNTRPKTDATSGTSDGAKTPSAYLKLAGEQTIRILDRTEDVPFYWQYYMPVNVGGTYQDRGIVVGRNGPIAQYMKEIGSQDKKFRKPGKRMLLNVLDRADNTVKILDLGNDLLNKFSVLHKRIRKSGSMEAMNVWDFDLNIVSTPGKEPKDVQRAVYPGEDQEPLAAELRALLKYDLSTVARPMPEEMQVRLLAGDDLLEILRELNWERPTPTVPQA